MMANQRGVALITALLVVALATVATVSLTASHQLDLRRTTTSHGHDQMLQHVYSTEALTTELLSRAGEHPELAAQMADRCESPPMVLEVEGMLMEARLTDLHCRLNLNNLADDEDDETERAFLELVEQASQGEPGVHLDPEGLLTALREWLDPEVEDDWYSRQQPPYRPGNRLLTSATELLLVRGMTEAGYHALRPYITALPATGTAISALNMPELLRTAYNLPLPAEMDPDDAGTAWSGYVQLAVLMERNGRQYRHCSHLHGLDGNVVLRRLRHC